MSTISKTMGNWLQYYTTYNDQINKNLLSE